MQRIFPRCNYKRVSPVLPNPQGYSYKMSVSKRWCYTLNNYTAEEALAIYNHPAATYHICGKEVGYGGTAHLQGYMVFKTAQRLAGVRKISDRAHWEIAKGTTAQNVAYCSKDGDYMENGIRPRTPKEVGMDKHERWLDVIRAAKEGTCEEEYPREFVQYKNTIVSLYCPDVKSIDEYTGLWWYGEPGTGKSRKAREDYPDLYDKLLNKWWDGYVNEDTVLIDDIDPSHNHMGLYLKRYTDHYPFRAEYKGGSKVIRPKRIIVTSNYSIDEVFTDPVMAAAVKRRFKVTHFNKAL